MDLGLKTNAPWSPAHRADLGLLPLWRWHTKAAGSPSTAATKAMSKLRRKKSQQRPVRRSLALVGDVSDASMAETLVAQAVEALGGLDLLVTNAGGPPPGLSSHLTRTPGIKPSISRCMSHVRLIRAALPHLRESNAASVLTVTSISVKQPIENLVLSNSIRAATVGLTKSLAMELGKDGIRFNSILPGWTETERVNDLMAARAKNNTTVEEETVSSPPKVRWEGWDDRKNLPTRRSSCFRLRRHILPA